MTDLEILSEIRQIENSMPVLKREAKEAANAYKVACQPLKPARDRLKASKAAVTAAKARMSELMALPIGGT